MTRSLDFDPIHALAAPDAQHDPFLVYATLLEYRPVFWCEPLRSWLLARYTDCSGVLRDNDGFSGDWSRVGETAPPAARSIRSLDPPEQTPVGRLFVEAVRASHDDGVRDEVTRQANGRPDALSRRESFVFVAEFSEPFALATIARLLGVPEPDPAWFVPLANAISDGMDGLLWAGMDGIVGFVARWGQHFGVDAALTAPPLRGITLAVAERTTGVHCLEHSAAMRAVLVARLAARPDLRDRVTVLDVAAPDFCLARRFDYVYFAGVLEHVPPQVRPALFWTVAAHPVPGGTLAVDMVLDLPGQDPPERHREDATVGECRYDLSVGMRSRDRDQTELRHVYRTHYQDRLVATEVVERDHHFHRREAVLRDLAAAGLVATGGSAQHESADQPGNPGTLVARHEPTASRTDTSVPSTDALDAGGRR